MQIELDDKYREWLIARVSAGDFASIEQAVATAVQRLILDDGFSDDDLVWAKPLIDDGVAQLEGGESFSHDEVFSHLKSLVGPGRS
jgi:antitoxin ParD1/3/4